MIPPTLRAAPSPAEGASSDPPTEFSADIRAHLRFLAELLPSYFNLYHSVRFRLADGPGRITELADDSELSRCVVRLRKQKPDLWTTGEMQQLARSMSLGAGVCTRLIAALDWLGDLLLAEPPRTNAALLQACDIHRLRFRRRSGDRWTLLALHKLHQGAASLTR